MKRNSIVLLVAGLVGGSLAMAMSLTIDWSAYLTAVTGSLTDLLALAAGVVATVISAAVIFKGVKWVAHAVTSFMR